MCICWLIPLCVLIDSVELPLSLMAPFICLFRRICCLSFCSFCVAIDQLLPVPVIFSATGWFTTIGLEGASDGLGARPKTWYARDDPICTWAAPTLAKGPCLPDISGPLSRSAQPLGADLYSTYYRLPKIISCKDLYIVKQDTYDWFFVYWNF